MNLYESISQNLKEGMHLVAFCRYNPTGEVKMIEDSDYSSKSAFAIDLRANDFTVKSIADNADLYVIDNSNYRNLKEVYEKMMLYKQMIKEDKLKGRKYSLWEDNYNESKEFYNKALEQL